MAFRKLFNVAGPCIPGEHYMIPAVERLPDVLGLIESRQYFVIHAARQSGKTTLLKVLTRDINAKGEAAAMYCSLEALQAYTDPDKALPLICGQIEKDASIYPWYNDPARSLSVHEDASAYDVASTLVRDELSRLARRAGKPLVIFFDEADCLSGGALVSFLRQLRNGYIIRDDIPFPVSVALVGMRDIRDYKAQIRPDSETLGSASPFNIVKEALTLANFTRDEIARLYRQHTEATGQVFEEAAIDASFHWTCGQPWLVNALACECVEKIHGLRYAEPITAADIVQAKETLVRQRDVHIDSLMERLKEPRVREIVEPVILGEDAPFELMDNDCKYVLDLGILKLERGALVPANPIYAEVILRLLTYTRQMEFLRTVPEVPWVKPDGLDMSWLLRDFQKFWRENAESWKEAYGYKEAGPQLVLNAFLQRVVNGGGKITREMALGSGRMDLCVEFRGARYALELKMRANYRPEQSHAQFVAYLERLGLPEGWMPIFDPALGDRWGERLFWKDIKVSGKTLHLVGL